MICENCKNRSDCRFYFVNIEPVLHTQQGQFVNDKYLFALFKCLDDFTCDYCEPQESEVKNEKE